MKVYPLAEVNTCQIFAHVSPHEFMNYVKTRTGNLILSETSTNLRERFDNLATVDTFFIFYRFANLRATLGKGFSISISFR